MPLVSLEPRCLKSQLLDFPLAPFFAIFCRSWLMVCIVGDLLRFCFILARDVWEDDAQLARWLGKSFGNRVVATLYLSQQLFCIEILYCQATSFLNLSDWVAWDLYARFVTYRRVCCCDFQLEEEQSSGVRSSAGAWSKRSMTGCFSFLLTCCFTSARRQLFFVKLS